MAKPIILADDPEPVVVPPPITLWIVRFIGFGDRSVMCLVGEDRHFFSEKPADVCIFESRDDAEASFRDYVKRRSDGRAYVIEPFDSLPADFIEQVRKLNPYFKETP